jgi:hypothetical protein
LDFFLQRFIYGTTKEYPPLYGSYHSDNDVKVYLRSFQQQQQQQRQPHVIFLKFYIFNNDNLFSSEHLTVRKNKCVVKNLIIICVLINIQ